METQIPENLLLSEDFATCDVVGTMSIDECVEMIDNAIRYCRDNRIGGLLVDITRVSGFPPPSTTERFLFTKKWAETARGKLAVSMVAPFDLIDPDKIGVTMADNRGLTSDVFTDKAEAVQWLLTARRRLP